MLEIINQIVILAEELATEYEKHRDNVARLYAIQMHINMAIGKRMKQLRTEGENYGRAGAF